MDISKFNFDKIFRYTITKKRHGKNIIELSSREPLDGFKIYYKSEENKERQPRTIYAEVIKKNSDKLKDEIKNIFKGSEIT